MIAILVLIILALLVILISCARRNLTTQERTAAMRAVMYHIEWLENIAADGKTDFQRCAARAQLREAQSLLASSKL